MESSFPEESMSLIKAGSACSKDGHCFWSSSIPMEDLMVDEYDSGHTELHSSIISFESA